MYGPWTVLYILFTRSSLEPNAYVYQSVAESTVLCTHLKAQAHTSTHRGRDMYNMEYTPDIPLALALCYVEWRRNISFATTSCCPSPFLFRERLFPRLQCGPTCSG